MKKILAWLLLLVMVVGMFAGCHNTNTTEPTGAEEYISAEAAMEYLKALYKTGDALKTPRDYERYGVIRVGGEPFTVVWTVEGADDLVKVVTDDSEIVIIDVDEQCQEDTPYTLTATITDKGGNSVSFTWNCILPKALDVGKVLEEAYALAPGETLPYEVTLTGKVTEIAKMYDAEYKNITVIMVVEGYEQYPIECYRLKGDGVENLQIGNIITVTGTIKNYNGTIEFDQGCILEKVEKGDAVDAPTDPLEIVAAAYALKDGESLPYVATLTGKVTDIESPYDPDYSNITVAIEVEGAAGKPIVCYRLKGTGVDQVAIDDTITVMGIIKNYKGKIEFDSGCVMTDRISGGRAAEKPSTDPVKIMADVAKLGWGQHLNYYATLTGKVIDVESPYDSAYSNITVVISVDGYANMPITCYRLKGNGVEKIARGDIITVKGIIENYKGKLEFGSGCTLLDRLSGGGVAKPETAHTATIMADAAKLSSGQHLDYYSSLTGVVTEIESPYDAAYGNISVIMTVAGYENYPIICYRLKSGAYSVASIAVGDTITVRGVLENYNGKLEYGSGCTLSYRKSGGGVSKPESSDAASILDDALALEDGQKLSYYANLTGKVVEIDSPYDKNYGNISVIIEVENPAPATRSEVNIIRMLCYRLKSGAYDASKIAVGDTITVRGVIENYKGEIQFGSGSTLSKRVSGGGVAKPESSNFADIWADAQQLAAGEKLDYYANVTGVVTKIGTAYDASYGNISVYIDLENGQNIQCYRMKSGKADASKIRIGDTITVRGVLTNYKDAIQFDTGCTVEKIVEGYNPGDSMTAKEILTAAYALPSASSAAEKQFLDGQYTLTGVITSVDKAYDSSYKNITVTMVVEGCEDMPIQAYRLANGAASVADLKEGDTITVSGQITKYNNKVQFDQGCVLDAVVPGEAGDSAIEIPENSPVVHLNDVANRVSISTEQQVWSENGVTVTNDKAGSSSNVNGDYTNPARFYKGSTVTVEYPGMTRIVFYMDNYKDTYADELINSMASVEGIVITREGRYVQVDLYEAVDSFTVPALVNQIRILEVYACTGTTPPEGGSTPDTPDTPDTPVAGAATVVIYNPASGKALSSNPSRDGSYYLGGVDVTVNGDTVTGYGATEQWVIIDNGDGTYSFNFGGKNLAMGASFTSTPLGEANDKWKVIDAGNGLYYLENTGRTDFRLQWRDGSDYNYFSGYQYNNTGDGFKFAFYVLEGTLPNFGQGGSTTPDTPVTPPAGDDGFVDAPVAGTAYKFGVNLPPLDNANYYADGTISSDDKYYNTTIDVANAIDVYIEEVSGGVYVYTYLNNVKKYLVVEPRTTDATKVWVRYYATSEATPSLFVMNTQYKYMTTTVSGTDYVIGTYTNAGTTYTTLSASKASFLSDTSVIGVSQFPAWFMTGSGNQGGTDTPDTPDTPVQPGTSASLNFKDGANRVSHSTEQQIWQQNGITMTNDKATSITDNFDSAPNFAHVRWYNGSIITVEYPGMTRIVFEVSFEDRVDALADSLSAVNGATVTVDGLNVTVDFAQTDSFAFTLVSQTRVSGLTVYTGTTPGGGTTPPSGDDNTGDDDTTGNTLVENPVAGEAYKWAIDQKGKGVTLYFNGQMAATYYGGTTENIAEAVDVKLEATEGGYYLTFQDDSGAKKYITIVINVNGEKTHRNFTISDAPDNVYTFNTEYKTLTTVLSNGDECYFGTYGDYTTFSVSTIDKISTSYPSYLCVPGGEGGSTTPDTPVVPDTPVTPPAGGSDIAVGTAYKFGMINPNKSATDVYYLAGGMDSYYMATTTDIGAAIDVYLEAANGGYYFYTMNGGSKQYINMVVNDTHVNGAYEQAASTVYTYDATSQTLISNVNGSDYWFGTRNDKSYTTVGPCATSYNGFVCHFYTADGNQVSGGNGGNQGGEEPTGEIYNIVSGENLTISLNATADVKTVTFDYILDDGTFNIALRNDAASYYGYFAFDIYGNVDKYDGVSVEALGNGKYRVTFDVEALTKCTGNANAAVVDLYVYGMWTDGCGKIMNLNIVQGSGSTTPDTPELGGSVTISFADVANRTTISDLQQVWQQNGITVTNDKAGSKTSINGTYYNPIRCYQGSSLTVAYSGMRRIVFKVGTYSGKDYAADLVTSLEGVTGITVTRDGLYVTVDFSAAVNSFFIPAFAYQVRLEEITVYN